MLRRLTNIKILPRWIIILIDLGLTLFAVSFAYLLRFNFNLNDVYESSFYTGVIIFVGFGFISSVITGLYAGIIRYTGFQDGLRVTLSVGLSSALVGILNTVMIWRDGHSIIPYSVIVIAFLMSTFLLLTYRLMVKSIFSYYRGTGTSPKNIMIFGAGQSGQKARHIISQEPNARVVGFLENDPNKIDKVLNGVRIFNAKQNLDELFKRLSVHELIISVQNLSVNRKQLIIDKAINANVKVRNVPPVHKWIKGELSARQIKEIRIEDLLGRDIINIENFYVKSELEEKRILITGAAGSIGSEITRQVCDFMPEQIILFDQSESAMFNLQAELRDYPLFNRIHFILGDITNQQRINWVFSEFNPHLVFHAAAYKHVPLMECNPSEAVLTNVLGTKILAETSERNQVEKFIYISTDKAVNPTNVMGASKRIGEMFVQSFNNLQMNGNSTRTKFITTRFGNVLGSNGSVIPLFKDQIAKGGPVTVTHPDITRFFMTIPEACQLVLEAAAMGKGGEIFIFDMGQSVKIIYLAEKMIQLSGLKPREDIEIVYTGLREGEKLFEELLAQKENTVSTYHSKIMIAEVEERPFFQVNKELCDIIDLSQQDKEFELVQSMKKSVPEFISNSSKYEVLDKEYLG